MSTVVINTRFLGIISQIFKNILSRPTLFTPFRLYNVKCVHMLLKHVYQFFFNLM